MRHAPLDLVQGTLELVVLRAISAGGAMHGFAILDWIRATTEEALIVEDGALYHALHRMRGRRWIEGAWGVSEKGRRARYYRLTPAGRKALEAEAERWDRYVEAMARIAAGGAGA